MRDRDDEKVQLTLMQPLLEAGASVTENVREALLRDDFGIASSRRTRRLRSRRSLRRALPTSPMKRIRTDAQRST